MGNPRGFLEIDRKEAGNRPVQERVTDFGEVEQTLNTMDRILQASRCMDCGIPFCHWSCPLANLIPEWQDMVYKGQWKKAIDLLHSTNNLPEITGRICPAPCEKGCVLSIAEAPVTIRENEAAIVERAFMEGFIQASPPVQRTGKVVAVIGSGPAGLACAEWLNSQGHSVTVFEREMAVGGLLRYGIPDFKLSKSIIDRRISIYKEEGIKFLTRMEVGEQISASDILDSFDAVCLAVGAEQARDLQVPRRELNGIHFAMDFLRQQNKVNAGIEISYDRQISARGKHVVVIGGGDTGSDCVGTAIRQRAKSVTQIEILPKPKVLKNTSSHEEGCSRLWEVNTMEFAGRQNQVSHMHITDVNWINDKDGKMTMQNIPGSERELEADLVLLAMGFVHPVHAAFLETLGIAYDVRNNIAVNTKGQTNIEKVFAAGDACTGASLVMRAIDSGRQTAEEIHKYLAERGNRK